MSESPQITGASYISSTMDVGTAMRGLQPSGWDSVTSNKIQGLLNSKFPTANPPTTKEIPMASTARIVKVFIADPSEDLKLSERVLYTGEEKLTDLTDQELFFEVPIQELLSKHNLSRAKTLDKKQAEKFGRDIFLEPARIRDLKMVVVTVAQF